jgi:LysM repeat protein
MVDNCDAFYKVVTGDSCDSIAAKNGISVEQFRSWNTNIGGTACNGLWADAYVCVSVIGHTPTPTNPGNGIATPSPTQPGMVSNCDAFYKVVTGDSCDSIAAKNGITAAQLSSWNNVGTACNGLWADAYVCVSIIGHTPTPTNPGNGIATPSPTQPGMVSNCDAFYRIVTGDSCDSIASKNGISVAQLASWNSVGGTACNGLWANTYICVSIIGHTPTPTNPGNGISTPSPIQDGMTRNCKTFHRVVAGDSCATIASRYRITTAQFISWNPAARSDCTGLWANTYACVAVL